MAANRPASAAVVVETAVSQNHLTAARNLVAVAAEVATAVVEIVPNLNRPMAPSIHRRAAEAARGSSAAVRQLSLANLLPASCRPEYKRPASLLQKCGCTLGSVSSIGSLVSRFTTEDTEKNRNKFLRTTEALTDLLILPLCPLWLICKSFKPIPAY